jgi:hypothetical protein
VNRLLWPGLIFVLIGGIVIVDVSMLALATANPPRIVTDTVSVPWAIRLADPAGEGTVSLDVLDPGGRAAADVVVSLKAKDGGRAPIVRRMMQTSPGRFATTLPTNLVAPRLEISVSRGGRIVHREIIDSSANAAAGGRT